MALTRVRGDTYPIEAIIKVDGEPIDLTGSTLTFSMRNVEDSNIISINGIINTNEIGRVSFTPSPQDVANVGEYIIDIQREYNGIIATHIVDRMTLTQDVTI
jgi:hypothetical protein